MEIKLTEAQQAVIDDRGGQLLVSAAAGSGKTKVLVDRVLALIAEGAGIENFLIITYTKAAASELRMKLQKALQEAILNHVPGDYHTALLHLNMAHISTVHAFCSDLLKEYAMYLELPSDFRIGEEQECRLLRDRAMEKTLNRCYDAMTEPFAAFRDCYGTGRNDKRLASAIETMYDKSLTQRDPDAWLQYCLDLQEVSPEQDLSETKFGAYLLEEFRRQVSEAYDACLRLKEAAEEDEALVKSCGDMFQSDLQLLAAYRDAPLWDDLFHLGKPKFARMGSTKKCTDAQLAEDLKTVRKQMKHVFEYFDYLFSGPSSELIIDVCSGSAALTGAVEACRIFGEEFRQQKRQRHLLDFSDLEHETLRLLYGSQGNEPVREASKISARFREILVDEYQDSNSIQDAIFYGVSDKGRKLFMVGDVKQSIYRFRLAEPEIFLRKYGAFPMYFDAEEGAPRKILLSENFRSSQGVIDAVNAVMFRSMCPFSGGLAYTEAEALRPGKEDQTLIRDSMELCLLDGDTVPDYDKVKTEAKLTADKICQMLKDKVQVRGKEGLRSCEAGDFAILLRSPKISSPEFISALRAKGIPAFCDNGEDLMQTEELLILSSFVEVLVNPRKDIPLVALLTSPLFCVNADTLALSRSKKSKVPFFETLRIEPDKKIQDFFTLLEELRAVAAANGVVEAFNRFLERTNALEIFRVMSHGEERLSNVAYFQSLLASQEAGGAAPEQLVELIDRMRERGIQSDVKQQSDSVLITSIHKSKGLEYPIVLLPLLSKKFNQEDSKEQLLFDTELGIGTNCTDLNRMITYSSVQKKAISEKLKHETVSEELRILYVAMTRAQDRLIALYTADKFSSIIEKLSSLQRYFSREAMSADAKSLGDWILLEAMARQEGAGVFGVPVYGTSALGCRWNIHIVNPEEEPIGDFTPLDSRGTQLDFGALEDRLAFRYPHSGSISVPSKLAATQLKNRPLDSEISDNAEVISESNVRSFSSELLADRAGPEEIGTAMHAALQFISYAACRDIPAAKEELLRLWKEGYLSERQYHAVSAEKIVRLFTSELGKRILSAERVVREFKFSVMYPASELFPDAGLDEMLLQGVADCAMIEDGKLSVIDYKTDRISESDALQRAEKYRGQVELYAKALGDIFACPVRDKIIYFLHCGKAVILA